MRVAVVGLGGTGSAAAYYLARSGHAVTGYEQFALDHSEGSSHGASRIIRYTYPDPLYTTLMAGAYPLWDALEEAAGEELFVRCGGLYFGPDDHPELRQVEESLRRAGLSYTTLRSHPTLRLRPNERAIFQADSGFLRADRCVSAHQRLAVAQGAVVRTQTRVVSIEPHGSEIVVQTEGDAESYDRVIVTAGPWIGQFASHLAERLTVTRQHVVYVALRDTTGFDSTGLPVWIDADTYWYGFPTDGVFPGIKLARHVPGEPTDPNNVDRVPSVAELDAAVAYAQSRFVGVTGEITHATTCLYTNAPDEDFVIDRAPESSRIWLISGCSGHGFKFTTLLGKLASQLATDEAISYDLSRFRLARF